MVSAPARTLMEAADEAPSAEEHDVFEIAAKASLHDRGTRTLKHNDTFAVFDYSGDIIPFAGRPEGVYNRDTRHLSYYLLTIQGGVRPILLSSSLRDDNSVLNCDLTNPDIGIGQDGALHNNLLHIHRTRFIYDDYIYERLTTTNYDDQPHEVSLELSFSSDFDDLFEVRGAVRMRRGTVLKPEVGDDNVLLSYQGLDGLTRYTALNFAPKPTELTENTARFRFDLAPRSTRTITIEIACRVPESIEPIRHRLVRCYRKARSDLRHSSSRATTVLSSNEVFNQTARRCISDTYMLLTDTEFGPYPYAGIPWYSTVFGRDALITALQTLWLDPEIARGVLRYLAYNQATEVDPKADAEPGKILHEMRHGEMALLGEVPFRRYYGSIDSTPLFIMLAGAYLKRTDDIATIAKIWPNIEAALNWIDEYGDRDGDGYVEYGRHCDDGLINQGWKDSHDSVFHMDGTMARGPIALCEVQAYVFGAWNAAADILERMGHPPNEAATYRAKALDLADRFDRDFFDEDIGTFVIALDGKKQPCRVRSSNAGHVLLTGLAKPERALCVAQQLMDRSAFSGWGIRTIPAGEARYNPMSYHNGSIWPHDNALIGAGFAHYGFRQQTLRIFDALFAASTYVDLRRLPELFCGFRRRPSDGPTLYPVSCIPQAWAAATLLSLLQSCLGLTLDAGKKQIQFERPILPPFLNELHLCKLSLGNGWVDLHLLRSDHTVMVNVAEQAGDLHVLTRV